MRKIIPSIILICLVSLISDIRAQASDDAGRMDAETFRARYGIETGYITASNAWFEKIATVPARYNRIIFYEGTLFHSGEIAHPELLSRDPRAGRLSLNGFFTCRRNLAPT